MKNVSYFCSQIVLMYNEMNVLELSEQEIIRRNSMNELRAMGIDPYPAAEYVTNAFSTDIKAEFKDDAEPRKVSVAGRMMTRRVMGKASFVELQDSKGRIQVYITRDDICPGEDKELYNTVFKRLLDLLHWNRRFCFPYSDGRNQYPRPEVDRIGKIHQATAYRKIQRRCSL
jgi:lysyl-tRNA synthetase class II